jgi:hypothetical protein
LVVKNGLNTCCNCCCSLMPLPVSPSDHAHLQPGCGVSISTLSTTTPGHRFEGVGKQAVEYLRQQHLLADDRRARLRVEPHLDAAAA